MNNGLQNSLGIRCSPSTIKSYML